MFGIEQWAQGSHPFFVQHPSLTNYVIGFIVLLGWRKRFTEDNRYSVVIRQSVCSCSPILVRSALVSTRRAPNPEQSLNTLLSQSP